MFKTISAVVIAALAFGWLGLMDYESALIMDAIEKEQRPKRATNRDTLFPLSHPILYRAVICQSDYGEKPDCRFYAERM